MNEDLISIMLISMIAVQAIVIGVMIVTATLEEMKRAQEFSIDWHTEDIGGGRYLVAARRRGPAPQPCGMRVVKHCDLDQAMIDLEKICSQTIKQWRPAPRMPF